MQRSSLQSAASTKPMEFGMRIFQSSKNTKQCTKCSETFKYVSIKKIHWVLLSFFLCQENETFLNFQLLWNMHGNFEGLRSITTFGLPRIHKIKKIVKFTKKKITKLRKLPCKPRESGWVSSMQDDGSQKIAGWAPQRKVGQGN